MTTKTKATKTATRAKANAPAVAPTLPPVPAQDLEAIAKAALFPSVNAAAVVSTYAKDFGTDGVNITTLRTLLADDTKDMWAGDMKRAEAMLFCQAHALQSIFTRLARRAESQDYLKQWEAYLRMAMKAQNQCRMTLESLATTKNPPVVFARQANINNGGQQQVNNGTAPETAPVRAGAQTRAENSSIEKNKLLEVGYGERLDDSTQGTAGRTNPYVETVEQVHGATHG